MSSLVFKPASFLMYFMSIPVFFVLGMALTAWSGAAEGQGLAGGAIVLFYGFIGAFVRLIFMIIVALRVKQLSVIKKINILLIIVFLASAAWIVFRILSDVSEENQRKESTPATTAQVSLKHFSLHGHSFFEKASYRNHKLLPGRQC